VSIRDEVVGNSRRRWRKLVDAVLKRSPSYNGTHNLRAVLEGRKQRERKNIAKD